MIRIIARQDADLFPELFAEAAKLWRLARAQTGALNGTQRDARRMPDPPAVRDAVYHFCLWDERVVGYQCLAPTLRPDASTDVMPEICEGPPPRAADTYELSRYCLSSSAGEGPYAVGPARSELIAGVVEWGLACGITKVITAFEPIWILRAMQLRFCVRPLGLQCRIGGQAIVATELTFDPATLATVRAFRRNPEPVAEFCGQLGAGVPKEARLQ